ncbi:helix-turn-helix domain-containing protein (plasmid) [Borreliella yangtzensis]
MNQKKYFLKVFGCVKFLYNKMLNYNKNYYLKNKKVLALIQVSIKINFL